MRPRAGKRSAFDGRVYAQAQQRFANARIDYFSFSYCSSVDAPTGGVSFYGIHLAEIICYLFGNAIEKIVPNQFGKTVTVLLQYSSGMFT